ncbi:hypothetical protein [Hoeflea sp.]|uniref:hypothetical protein n=1 Tax=Hoeflea sp. TaxID=1940281 RepID=UPI003BB1D43F
MLQQLFEMRVQFLQIRDAAKAINQPLLVYLAEMGMAECDERMADLRTNRHR